METIGYYIGYRSSAIRPWQLLIGLKHCTQFAQLRTSSLRKRGFRLKFGATSQVAWAEKKRDFNLTRQEMNLNLLQSPKFNIAPQKSGLPKRKGSSQKKPMIFQGRAVKLPGCRSTKLGVFQEPRKSRSLGSRQEFGQNLETFEPFISFYIFLCHFFWAYFQGETLWSLQIRWFTWREFPQECV